MRIERCIVCSGDGEEVEMDTMLIERWVDCVGVGEGMEEIGTVAATPSTAFGLTELWAKSDRDCELGRVTTVDSPWSSMLGFFCLKHVFSMFFMYLTFLLGI